MQLRIGPTFYGEAGGQFLQTFTFRNRSDRTCRLRGWPRLNARTRRVRQGGPKTPASLTVFLGAGGAASFDVYGEDWNHVADKPCPKTRVVLVTPPGATSALRVKVKLPNCGPYYVAPVIAGTKDRTAWSTVVP